MDVVLSVGLMLVLWPLAAILAACVAMQKDGPVFYVQQRVGRNRSEFSIWKFRTMTDGQVNSVGRILRPLGLDELPQLWNILRGDMSFVGPRPLTHADVDRLGWQGPECDARWSCAPGLIGLAQFSPVCSARWCLALDQRYVANAHIGLDLRLLAWAMLVPFCGKAKVARWMNLSLEAEA